MLFQSLSDWLKGAGWYFLITGFLIAILRTWPRFSASSKIRNQDIKVTIKIGNIFKQSAQIVIGTNTTFDTEVRTQLIAKESLQGQFTNKYYIDWKDLDSQIEKQLEGRNYDELNGQREGKSKRYDMGETVKVYPKSEKAAYLVAIADLNAQGNATGSIEKLRRALGGLWTFIKESGDHGKIAVPILGTGNTRLTNPRKDIIIEIIRSFLAACSESTFCKELIVVVRPKDAEEYSIDIKEFQRFLEHECQYRQSRYIDSGLPSGTGID